MVFEQRPDNLSSFFFNDTATTEIYTLSLHDALPISRVAMLESTTDGSISCAARRPSCSRSEEHTSELQSPYDLVCRLLLEKIDDVHGNRERILLLEARRGDEMAVVAEEVVMRLLRVEHLHLLCVAPPPAEHSALPLHDALPI